MSRREIKKKKLKKIFFYFFFNFQKIGLGGSVKRKIKKLWPKRFYNADGIANREDPDQNLAAKLTTATAATLITATAESLTAATAATLTTTTAATLTAASLTAATAAT